MTALHMVEDAMQFARYRAAVLAGDVANAGSAGFAPRDVSLSAGVSDGGLRFASVMRDVSTPDPVSTVEYAMGAIAKNSVWYRALTQQTRAMLREFRTVAEEERR
jgi:flagellar basal body rod protein FlgB